MASIWIGNLDEMAKITSFAVLNGRLSQELGKSRKCEKVRP